MAQVLGLVQVGELEHGSEVLIVVPDLPVVLRAVPLSELSIKGS